MQPKQNICDAAKWQHRPIFMLLKALKLPFLELLANLHMEMMLDEHQLECIKSFSW